MPADNYLQELIQRYAMNTEGKKITTQIYQILKKLNNGYFNRAQFSGFIAKETGISLPADADINISLSSISPEALAKMCRPSSNAARGANSDDCSTVEKSVNCISSPYVYAQENLGRNSLAI